MTAPKPQHWIFIAAVLGGIAVILGAVGAHALKTAAEPKSLVQFHTALRYHSVHSLALLITGVLLYFSVQKNHTDLFGAAAATCFLCGILLFSGSLYGVIFTKIDSLALLTPIGGLFFIAGWGLLSLFALRLP